MFRIPDFYDVTSTLEFKSAAEIITNYGRGDIFKGMCRIDGHWADFCEGTRAFYAGEVDYMVFADDDDFFDHFGTECSAYNIVFENFSKLFEKKT